MRDKKDKLSPTAGAGSRRSVTPPKTQPGPRRTTATSRRRRGGLSAGAKVAIVVAVAVAALGLVFVLNNRGGSPSTAGQGPARRPRRSG